MTETVFDSPVQARAAPSPPPPARARSALATGRAPPRVQEANSLLLALGTRLESSEEHRGDILTIAKIVQLLKSPDLHNSRTMTEMLEEHGDGEEVPHATRTREGG